MKEEKYVSRQIEHPNQMITALETLPGKLKEFSLQFNAHDFQGMSSFNYLNEPQIVEYLDKCRTNRIVPFSVSRFRFVGKVLGGYVLNFPGSLNSENNPFERDMSHDLSRVDNGDNSPLLEMIRVAQVRGGRTHFIKYSAGSVSMRFGDESTIDHFRKTHMPYLLETHYLQSADIEVMPDARSVRQWSSVLMNADTKGMSMDLVNISKKQSRDELRNWFNSI